MQQYYLKTGRQLAFLFFFLPLFVVKGQDPFQISKETNAIFLGGQKVLFLEDPTLRMTLDQVQQADDKGEMKVIQTERINFKVNENAFWIKLKIKNNIAYSQWMLECNYPNIDYLQVYSRGESEVWNSSNLIGDMVPFKEREVKHRNAVIPIAIPEGTEKELYVRVQTSGVCYLPLTLVRSDVLYGEIALTETAYGIFFGIMLVMVLYNLMLFFTLNDNNYLYYSLLIVGFIMYTASTKVHILQYVFTDNPLLGHQSVPFALGFAYVFSALFTKSFLEVKKLNRRLNTILTVFIYVFIIITFLSFVIDYSFAIRFYLIIPLVLFVPLLLTTGIISLRNGSKAARFYILAWMVYFLALFAVPLYSFGILPPWFIFVNSAEISTVIQVTLLALALANKYAEIKAARVKAEEDNKRILREANEQLEGKVKERTREIEQQKEEIQTQNEELRQMTEEIAAQRDHIQDQHKELESAYQDLNLVGEVGWKITSTLSFAELMETVSESILNLFEIESIAIGSFDEEFKQMNFSVFDITGKKEVTKAELERTHWYNNALKSFEKEEEVSTDWGVGATEQANISIPLGAKGKKMGVITMETKRGAKLANRHLTTIQALASYIATALDNAQAYETINHKNTLITDSIRYAKTIQEAILPEKVRLDKWFLDYFVIFRPKDIVSGDFYWFAQHEKDPNVVFVAVADCTGHGVPGAFMSMIGSRLLSEIIVEHGVYEPNLALEQLDMKIRKSLKQDLDDKESNKDGMDLSLCRIRRMPDRSMDIHFAGAKSTVYHYDALNSTVISTRGDKRSIGGVQIKDKSFKNYRIQIKQGDSFFMATDGLVDQNAPDRTKFGSIKFVETLEACGSFPSFHQRAYLEEALADHMKEAEQRDDITIFGLKA